ncbi:hypothetical protein NVIRPANT_00044 [Pantoea sp. Nvir]|nr:hypothetical protein NVIRPANT_00044 [Pantoea sp. Nvir]
MKLFAFWQFKKTNMLIIMAMIETQLHTHNNFLLDNSLVRYIHFFYCGIKSP